MSSRYVPRARLGLLTFEQNHSAPYIVTGLGSINQIHCTLSPPEKQLGGDLIFFELLNAGIWTAQRGLLCLSIETTKDQVDELASIFDRIFTEHKALF
jgi:glutamate-1-semialdehyde 2,1-aminomutase